MFPETAPKSVDLARHNIMHTTLHQTRRYQSLGSISLPWTPDIQKMAPCSYACFMALGYMTQGFFAAFLACATSTLFLFGWCRDGSALDQAHLDRDEGLECRLAGDISVSNGRRFGSDDHYLCLYSSNSLFFSSILGGLSGALGELLPLRVDDNLSMPIVSGALFLILHR